jgi:hypothetical protein
MLVPSAAVPHTSASTSTLLQMPLVAVSDRQLAEGKADYVNYRVRVDQLKTHFAAAVRKEQDAYSRVQVCQQKVRESLTDPKAMNDVDLLAFRQSELQAAEEQWRHSSLFTAELRAEIVDLGKQRDEDFSDETRFCGLHTLDRAKPIPLRSEDIAPSPKKLIRPAYPVVDPRVQQNAASPHAQLNEEAFAKQFLILDTDKDGLVTEEAVIMALDAINDFGIENHSRRFIETTLAKLRSPLVDGRFLNYDQFVVVMLKFIEL